VFISISFGLFIYSFLLFFQPFGIADINENKSSYVLGFGIITFVVMLFNYTIIPALLYTFFDPEKWTIGKNIVFGLWNFVLIAFLNYFYTIYVGGVIMQGYAFLFIIVGTVTIGIFPLTILLLINELYLRGKHEKNAAEMSTQLRSVMGSTPSPTSPTIKIIGESKNDSLEIGEAELFYIKAVDNYCDVKFLRDKRLSSQLLRISLKNIESQLVDFPDILRCHRSYIINKRRISRISGNARAYYLHFETSDEQIPLSRGFKKDMLSP